MDTEKLSRTEEMYKCNEYTILDARWGQYVEGGKDETKAIYQGLNSSSGFQKALKNNDKIIAMIPCTPLVVYSNRHTRSKIEDVRPKIRYYIWKGTCWATKK